MPLGRDMRVGTRVKNANGRAGATMAYLKDMMPAGGYKVKWDDDSSESDVRVNQLDLEAGGLTDAQHASALALVTAQLGGVSIKAEKPWLVKGKLVQSNLIVSRPAYLPAGQELHAHTSTGGGLSKVHIKSGQDYMRNIFVGGNITQSATADDRNWIAKYRLRNALINSKQDYLDGKKVLPQP